MALRRAMRWQRRAGCAAGFMCLAAVCCGAAPARAASDTTPIVRSRAARKPIVLSPWEQAERGRDALEATSEGDRTHADYTLAMDEYRAIYHANPADVHAPAAVNAVAELLTEQGRGQRDAKSLQAAVGQYEFLRKQYPGSSLRVQALLAEGQIEENDLGDAAAAKEKYTLLLKQYPRSEQADEANAGLESLKQLPVVSSQLSGRTAGRRTAGASAKSAVTGSAENPPSALRGTGATYDGTRAVADQSQAIQKPAAGNQRSVAGEASSLPAMAQTSGAHGSAAPSAAADVPASAAPVDRVATDNNDSAATKRTGKRALVTGIRHWSTATYTRVAIDLGDNVTYEAARVPNPDRIYFDLHGAKLAQELVGKSFAVTDDGFLKKVRAAQYSDDVTRVVLDVNDVTEYSAFLLPNPYRLIIDIHGGKAAPSGVSVSAPQKRADPAPTVPNTIAVKQTSSADVAGVSDLPGRVDATTKPTSRPISAIVPAGTAPFGSQSSPSSGRQTGGGDSFAAIPEAPAVPADVTAPSAPDSSKKARRSKTKAPDNVTVADATPARAAVRTADGETSLVRALGLKIGRIVIDAGHGGHDSGTIGVDGIQEKDVVLDVALRLGKLLHDRLGAEVIYTRSDDTFIPLETRTAIANRAQADLFLSIHANSSQEESARGVETYYLNFTSDPTALDVAARENAVSDQSIHQLSDLVKKIALKDKIDESREFASDVEGSLYTGLQKGNVGLKDRGVKKAPFVVLIGANMPSILAEISFVTNPKDAEELAQPEYRQRVAESLYKGVARYEGGLSGTRPPTERAAVGQ